jgi:hypothetical protein
VEKYKDIAIEAFAAGKSKDEVLWILLDEECDMNHATRLVRIYSVKTKEAIEIEEAILQGVGMLDDGAAVDTMTMSLMILKGMHIGAKAAHNACLRRGIDPHKITKK